MRIEEDVDSSRAENEKRAAASSSVVAAVFLTGMKLVVGLMTGSLGILAEAAHSALDLVAAVITFLAVRFSGKPADRMHPYGHGKIENFSALIETVLLFITCAWIIYEAGQRLFFRAVEVDPSFWAFLVMAVSIVVDAGRSKILYRTARKYHSQALEADALHFSTDIWSSAVVIAGLVFVWLGQHVFPRFRAVLSRADAVAALGVACIVVFVSYRLGKRTVAVLLDGAPDGMAQQFKDAAGAVDGVLDVGQIRVRRSGPRLFVDMNIVMDRNLSFERAHAIADAVEKEVRRISPGADVVIHTDPREADRENIAKRIRAVANRNQMAVHNVSVHEDRGRMYVDLHLEVDDHLSLYQAHEMASHIEQDLKDDMPNIKRINTHIESRGTGIGDGQDVTADKASLVKRIQEVTRQIAPASRCHDIRVRCHGDKLSASMHCTLDDGISIIKAHELSTSIEERVKAAIPELNRVLVHVEPESR
ncbi:MAG: cation-efflux pump [Acidobacteriota bacterium]|nr:cation-efflux pump [Acidobacteriota bacterium]